MNTMPKIALGAWSWGAGAAGGDQVFGNHLFEDDLRPVFDKALECGMTLWDTAAVYGEGTSERILGSFVKDVSREQVILSTKFTPQIASDSPETMQEMLDGSKAHLHADVMDVYWIHNPMDVEKWTPKLIPLAQSGQIKTIGVSNHNLAEIKRANEILGAAGLKVSAVQNHFSLLHRSSERAGILDYCMENGITFYPYMVLEQGALQVRYRPPLPGGQRPGQMLRPRYAAARKADGKNAADRRQIRCLSRAGRCRLGDCQRNPAHYRRDEGGAGGSRCESCGDRSDGGGSL